MIKENLNVSDALKAEIKQLKEKFQTLLRQCSNMEMMNKKYYDMLKKGGLL